jgi:hypothetical protein
VAQSPVLAPSRNFTGEGTVLLILSLEVAPAFMPAHCRFTPKQLCHPERRSAFSADRSEGFQLNAFAGLSRIRQDQLRTHLESIHPLNLIYQKHEELRNIRGTLGLPGTVAPFRAWRGSRDLVAQSPKFHVSAVATFLDCSINVSTAHNKHSHPHLLSIFLCFVIPHSTSYTNGAIPHLISRVRTHPLWRHCV